MKHAIELMLEQMFDPRPAILREQPEDTFMAQVFDPRPVAPGRKTAAAEPQMEA